MDTPDLTISNDAVRIVWHNWPPRRMGWARRLAARLLLGVTVENRSPAFEAAERLRTENARLTAENTTLRALAEAAQEDLTRYVHDKVDACRICKYVKQKSSQLPCIACLHRDAWEWDKAESPVTEDAK